MNKRRIDIVARRRPPGGQPIAAVRWAVDPEVLLPNDGFTLRRTIAGATQIVAQNIRLPGALQPAPHGDWIIDDAQLGADHAQRSAAPTVAAVPTLAELATLKPLLVFALPNCDPELLEQTIEAAAEMLGDSHRTDIGLGLDHWGGRPAPHRAQLAGLRHGTTSEKRAYAGVVDHYRLRATAMLLFKANDFGLAILLGLGCDDPLPAIAGNTYYGIEAAPGGASFAQSKLFEPAAEWPRAPALAAPTQGDAFAGYPDFGVFFDPGSTWTPRAPAGDIVSKALIAEASRGPRSCRTPTAQLNWTPPPDEDEPTENFIPRLLTRGAMAWRIERAAFGAETAADDHPPPVVAGTAFINCHDAAPLLRSKDLVFEDDIDLPWGDAPLEGWYAYRVSGIDAFGILGPPGAEQLVRLRDRYPPPPPRPKLDRDSIELPKLGKMSVPVSLDWDAPCELAAPDAAEFRVRQLWTAVTYFALAIERILPIGDPLDAVQADARVVDADGKAIGQAVLALLVGGTLLTVNGEFAILGANANSVLRIRRSAGRAPPQGDASARYAEPTVEQPTVARLTRDRAQAAAVQVVALNPLTLTLTTPTGAPIMPTAGSVYLHLLGEQFAANSAGNQLLVDRAGAATTRARDRYDHIQGLGLAAAQALLDGSPALLLPPHRLDLQLDPPNGFAAGTLRISVSAADDKSYVGTEPDLGNEGPRAEVVVAVRSAAQPKPAPRWVPRLWARDAGQFVDAAVVSLSWGEMTGAIRYEVERALEPSLGLSPAASEDDLLRAAQRTDSAFERITNAARMGRWSDSLPGRAPTRAVYRVRGISASEVASEWTIVALVRVPDTRIAPHPILFRAAAVQGQDRAIACCWTQPGPTTGIGFAIETRAVDAEATLEEGWRRISDFLPGTIRPDRAGRYEAELPDCAPGQWLEVRIVPVRHALDPDDPRAQRLRRIEGRASNIMRAKATGELRAPKSFRAQVSTTGYVTLRWTNQDRYGAIEIRRRGPERFGFERWRVAGDAESYREQVKLSARGQWTYEVAAIGTGRRAVSEQITIEWAGQ